MQRTQVYLTDKQQNGLASLASKTSQKKSTLIRLAIDHLLADEAEKNTDWKQALGDIKGVWSEYEEMEKLQSQVRKEFNRYSPE